MRLADLIKTTLAVGVPVAFLTGCDLFTGAQDSTNTNDASDWEASTDLVSEYGGYEFTDEQEAFGDPAVRAVDSAQEMLSIADTDTVPTPNAFAVRLAWGQLEGDPEATEIKDWDGSLNVSSGAVAVLRTIAFERPTDRVLRRDDRQRVDFLSKTRPHFDGLLLLIHNPQNDPTATLSMETASYSGSWTFEELQNADQIIPVDDVGNAVSISSVELPDDPACAGGALRGHWIKREGERGVFRGAWVSRLGLPIGHIRGHFGINDEGAKVWFGKIIARGGEVIGLARGTYDDDPEHPGGVFRGGWFVRGGNRQGEVGGRYVAAREADHAVGGFFRGVWRTNCSGDEVPSDEQPPGDRPTDGQ